jgi:uncharacterized membrane protein
MELLSSVLPVVLLGTCLSLIPVLTRPGLQFGVRVPPDRVDAPVIRQQRRHYLWWTGSLTGGFVVAAAGLAAGTSPLAAGLIPMLIIPAQLGTATAGYLVARHRIRQAKDAQDWYHGLTQVIAADTSWRTEPERFPIRWALPSVAVLAVTAVIGAVRYPSLPERLPIHFTWSGTPDGWAGTSALSAFSLVATQLLVTLLIGALLVAGFRSRPDLDADAPGRSARRYRAFLQITARSVLALAALTNLGLMLACLQMWQLVRISGATAALPGLVGGVIVLAAAVRTGQAGTRLREPAGDEPAGDEPATDTAHRDDDRFWTLGIFYANRDDPAVLVPKRFGVGWTINVANPRTWPMIAVVIVLIIAPALLAAL